MIAKGVVKFFNKSFCQWFISEVSSDYFGSDPLWAPKLYPALSKTSLDMFFTTSSRSYPGCQFCPSSFDFLRRNYFHQQLEVDGDGPYRGTEVMRSPCRRQHNMKLYLIHLSCTFWAPILFYRILLVKNYQTYFNNFNFDRNSWISVKMKSKLTHDVACPFDLQVDERVVEEKSTEDEDSAVEVLQLWLVNDGSQD